MERLMARDVRTGEEVDVDESMIDENGGFRDDTCEATGEPHVMEYLTAHDQGVGIPDMTLRSGYFCQECGERAPERDNRPSPGDRVPYDPETMPF